MSTRTLASCLLLATAAGLAAQPPRADLVLRGGKIVTVDPRLGEVQALAARGDRILDAGSDDAIERYVGAKTRVIELAGCTAVPGFIDGHGHFTGIGQAQQILDLRHVESWDEVVQLVAAAARRARPGEWILGRGWQQEKSDRRPAPNVEGFPTHESLSAVSPENPVCLTDASGYACSFNAKAMRLAGVDAKTPDPDGGEILREPDGRPSGVFRERAQALVRRVYEAALARRDPARRAADLRRTIHLADLECLSKGVTSFQDAGSPPATIDVMRQMAEAGELGVRLWVMIRESSARLAKDLVRYRMVGIGNGHLTVRAIKRMMDGALGSRGAWLLEPYADAPESCGLATASLEDVTETARLAAANGFQLCVHAIGDRANREVLNIYEKVLGAHPELEDPRWRIEHAQHLSAADIPRFARLGVIASMQGIHCTSDGPWVIARLGRARAEEGAYVWQKLFKSGALVTNGTDAPVEDVDPIACYHASVSRRLKDGTVFFPDQRMSRMQALESYTINAARAAFEEDIKGTLTPGKLADIVVLSRDILTVPEAEIPGTKVLYTIVGGKVRYAARGPAERRR